MIRRPPRSTRTDTLFPYTTLFRSLCALDHVEADAAEAEDDHIVAHLHLGGVNDRSHAGRDAAADIAARLERRVLTDLRDRDLGQHGAVGEGRAAHVLEDRLPLLAEAAGAVRHNAISLGRRGGGAKVGLDLQR